MELEQAKEVVANMAAREPAVYTKREQTSSWNRVYELAGEVNYTINGITVTGTEGVKLEYWNDEQIDLTGLVVKFTGDNAYTSAVEHDQLDDICSNWHCEEAYARITSSDNLVDGRVTKAITVVADQNPSWVAEVEIVVKYNDVVSIQAYDVDSSGNRMYGNLCSYKGTSEIFINGSIGHGEYYNGPAYIGYKVIRENDIGNSNKYEIATSDMITLDTSTVGMKTATVTYTDPVSGKSVSNTIDVQVCDSIYVTPTYDGCNNLLSIEVDSSKSLPVGVTYENGELLYNDKPLYIYKYEGRSSDESANEYDYIALPSGRTELYYSRIYGRAVFQLETYKESEESSYTYYRSIVTDFLLKVSE